MPEVLQYFGNCSSGWFFKGHYVDKPHWIVRCRSYLILSKLAFMAWSMTSEIHLTLLDHQGSDSLNNISCLLNYDQQCFHLSHNKFFRLLPWCLDQVWCCKAEVLELEKIAYSSVWLSNHTQSEAMCMSAHWLPQYYQPQWASTIIWTASIAWQTCYKLAHTKMLQNFLLTLV